MPTSSRLTPSAEWNSGARPEPARPAFTLRPARLGSLALAAGCLVSAAVAQTGSPAAGEPGLQIKTASPYAWELVVSPYTLHWSDDTDHRRVGLIGLERHEADAGGASSPLWGLSVFSNSFGQPSGYAYYGREWNGLAGNSALYAKVTAGVIYGYTGEYADKVPFNYKGFSPAIVPALGWRLTPQDAVQAAVLGSAGLMLTYNRRF